MGESHDLLTTPRAHTGPAEVGLCVFCVRPVVSLFCSRFCVSACVPLGVCVVLRIVCRVRVRDSLATVPCAVVWTDTGRVIGGLRQFSQHVFRMFGAVVDVGPKQLRRIAAFNLKESAQDRVRKSVGVRSVWLACVAWSTHRDQVLGLVG